AGASIPRFARAAASSVPTPATPAADAVDGAPPGAVDPPPGDRSRSRAAWAGREDGAPEAVNPEAESERLAAAHRGEASWYLWGPYLSERQWGTVREDYSEWGAAWDYFPHDHARSRAYRWGEDGLLGV